MTTSGFIAYPDSHRAVEDAISGAVELTDTGKFELKPWKKMQTIGFKIDDVIRSEIRQADFLIADVTYPNPNVFYEIGYAIGTGKPVIPSVNVAIEKAVYRIQQVGLFDTIGWASYSNAEELFDCIGQWSDHSWTSNYQIERNYAQPLYIIDTLIKTDFRNHIFHAVENSQVNSRSYDPAENPRLTAAQAIAGVSSSAGVIIPVLSNEIVDAVTHNLRASFVLGLCHGLEVEALAIQYENEPVPLDYRDFITNSTYKHETETHVSKFAADVLVWNQKASHRHKKQNLGLLGEINLGSPTAENETQNLGAYFVETAEYARALRAEGAVVIGRKGSGKSAIFIQIAEHLTERRQTCVVDLRPASHNLTEMREAILSVVSAGVFDHTIAAFWQYILYIEILLKIRELVIPYGRNDFEIQERLRKIEQDFSLTESIVSGDFTSRLDSAVKEVISIAQDSDNTEDLRTRVTNIMFENPIPQLRDAVLSFVDFSDEIVVLIDDLDKGWPPRQVENHDISIVKHLVEALNRIQRDLQRQGTEIRHLVFMRSDIYERLVDQTSDRGKYNPIKIDWSDPEQLRHLLRQRVNSSLSEGNQDEAWGLINPTMPSGEEAVEKMIESSLRRPRFLIDLCERTISFAVNRGHGFVTPDDVEEGLRQMSLYLVSDFGYELRDMAGTPKDIFYEFIGAPEFLDDAEIADRLSNDNLGLGITETVQLLLWYGFLGVVGPSGEKIFIYDREYDFRRLEAEMSHVEGEGTYVINPAFLKGLNGDQAAETV